MKPVIYIDVLFLLNFFINSIILYAVSLAAKRELGVLRLSIGAVVSALYSCVMFFPRFALLYTFVSKMIFSILLIMLVFGTVKIKAILKLTAVFYLVSFAFGGAVFAVLYLTNAVAVLGMVISGGEMYLNLPAGILMIGVGCAYLGVFVFTRICRGNYSKDKITIEFRVTLCDKSITVKALTDTGSSLVEPVSKKPVMVVEFGLISNILPDDIVLLYEQNQENDMERLLSAIESNRDTYKFCLVPFSALGVQNAIMLGVIPDLIEDLTNFEALNKCVIGIYKHKLSYDEDYNALINPDILKGTD